MSTEEMKNEALIKLAAQVGAETALKQMSEERFKEHQMKKRRANHNTKLLLENYRAFKAHSKNAVSTAQEAIESAEQGDSMRDLINLMWDPYCKSDLIIKSIRESAIRTTILMTHIDNMLNIYHQMTLSSKKTEERRRYNILCDRYIKDDNLSIDEIAEKYHITVHTVYTDIKTATDKLSRLLFGIDWE